MRGAGFRPSRFDGLAGEQRGAKSKSSGFKSASRLPQYFTRAVFFRGRGKSAVFFRGRRMSQCSAGAGPVGGLPLSESPAKARAECPPAGSAAGDCLRRPQRRPGRCSLGTGARLARFSLRSRRRGSCPPVSLAPRGKRTRAAVKLVLADTGRAAQAAGARCAMLGLGGPPSHGSDPPLVYPWQ